MDLNREKSEPLYAQLADAIESSIRGGRYKTGDRLPTEEQLIAQNGVSRATVRKAMMSLEARGLITRHRAKGTFVAESRVMQDLSMLRGFYDTLTLQGIEPETRLLDYRPITPPPSVQAILRQDTAVLLRRQYWVNASPLALVTAYLHPAAKAVSKAVAEVVPTYHVLQVLLALAIDHATLAIRAVPARREEARRLNVRAGAPILLVERTTFGASGDVLEHAMFRLRAEAYELALTLHGPTPVARAMRPINAAPRP